MMAAVALLLAAATPARDSQREDSRTYLGVFGGWGTFRDASPPRCFAVAVPARTAARPGWRPFASVVRGAGHGAADAVFFRLSATMAASAPVTLSVGERRFRLAGRDSAAWSPDAATARALVAAMRGQRSMSVAWVGTAGRPFADTYLLSGAATAVDAATLGCLAQR